MRTGSLLLDTHVLLWWRADDRRLGDEARQAIATADLVFVSAASAWEASIKRALGKLRMKGSFAQGVDESGFDRLPITMGHAEEAASLPAHHTDPFDRMLVAQARSEHLVLVTADARMDAYDVQILKA